jgi:hypothetical protein
VSVVRYDDVKHLIRLAALFLFGLMAFLVVRALMMPVGFGVFGHYRAGALDDNRTRPVRYAGQAACLDCHADAAEARAGGGHARVSCESCHGPLAGHAAEPDTTAARRPDPRLTCLRCHSSNPARPRRQPQIVVKDHAEEGPCTACHQPHRPGVA